MLDVDLSELPPEIFENLCGKLLVAEGFSLLPISQMGNKLGFDFMATQPPSTESWAVEVRLFRNKVSSTFNLRQTIEHMMTAAESVKVERYLLITNLSAAELQKKSFFSEYPSLEIWTNEKIKQLLRAHPSILEELVQLSKNLISFSRESKKKSIETSSILELRNRFRNLTPGEFNWKEYEILCVETLSELFVPPLNPPHYQDRSEDGLDIRDAIFSWSQNHRFWDTIGLQFNTRLIVAEFKNYSGQINQVQVENLRDYLYKGAMRNVGILCCRTEPSESAFKARRRAWQESQKLILFITDENFIEIFGLKQDGEDVTKFFDNQIDNFFIKLAP